MKTRAGLLLLQVLSVHKDGDVIGRDFLREYIKDQLPPRRARLGPVRSAKRDGNSSSNGSLTTKHLNSALRELQQRGVVVRGAANCVVLRDVSQVPALLTKTEAFFSRKAKGQDDDL